MSIVNIDKFSFVIRLLKSSFWGYRFQFLGMIALGFVAGLFGGIGIGAIIPLFSFVVGDENLETDFMTEIIEKIFTFLHIDFNVLFLLTFIVMLFVLKAVVIYLSHYINQRLSSDYEKNVRSELFKRTMKADWPYLLEQRVGYLESVLITDIHNCSGILLSLSGLIMVSTSLIMYALVALNISMSITLITFGIGIILFLLLKPLFYKLRKLSQSMALVSKQVAHHVGQHTIGAKTVKTMATEKEVIRAGDNHFESLRQMRIKIDLYNRIPGTFQEPIGLLFISVIFLFYYYSGNPLNIAAFAAIMYLIQKEFAFMQSIQSNLNNINQALPHLAIVHGYTKDTIQHKELDAGLESFKFNDSLELKDISFAYSKGGKILNGLNLKIQKGKMVGLIGPSGAGKTTLVDILLRLFNPGSGEVLLDSKSASEISTMSWRKNIGYVSQDTFLLNDTIENNIKFYDDLISQEDMTRAAKMAHIYDFVVKQPNKFATIVGERGVKLSGGQKQRIILARVLAKNPQFLVLDEATSALDNESELLIQKAIEKLKGKITILVIAHRLSTIINSDELLVLENGKIAEQDKPTELLKDKDSYFYKVYNIREK